MGNDKLIEILHPIGIDDNELFRTYILRGVRLRCILSPLPLNLHSESVSEYILKKALGRIDVGVMVHELNVSDLRYVEGTVLLASSERDRLLSTNSVTRECEEY